MSKTTLWIYGDSFSTDHAGIDWQWFKQLATHWNIQDIKNYSSRGAAHPYITYNISQTEFDWDAKDKIIIVLSELSRSWFIPNKPHINGILLHDLHEMCKEIDPSGKFSKAIELYHVYLQHIALIETQLHSILGYLSYLSQNKSAEILVLNVSNDDRFEYIYKRFKQDLKIADGSLVNISYSELEDNHDLRQYIWGLDPRANHLCKSNHTALSNLIIKYLEHDGKFDLDSLILKKPIITRKNVDDADLHESEILQELYNITRKHCERLF